MASLGANAEGSPYVDIRQPKHSFDVILEGKSDYQGELEYNFVLADGDVVNSGNTHCNASTCTISEPPEGSLIRSGAILTLSKDGVVTYATPYGPEYFNKNKIFSDPLSLGKYVTFELKKEGYKESELLRKIGTDNIYKLYLTLSRIYSSSKYSIQETISYIESGGWELMLENEPNAPFKDAPFKDELRFVKDILDFGSKIPYVKEYTGKLQGPINEILNFLSLFDDKKAPDITTNQIFQKLGEIEAKVDNISRGLDRFYDIYATNEIRKAAINIHERFLLVDSFNNQIINAISPANDILNYVDSSDLDREKRIKIIGKILSPDALRTLNTTTELLLGAKGRRIQLRSATLDAARNLLKTTNGCS